MKRLRAHCLMTWDARQYYVTSRWFQRQRQQSTPLWQAFVEVLREEQIQDNLLAEAHQLIQPR